MSEWHTHTQDYGADTTCTDTLDHSTQSTVYSLNATLCERRGMIKGSELSIVTS